MTPAVGQVWEHGLYCDLWLVLRIERGSCQLLQLESGELVPGYPLRWFEGFTAMWTRIA